MTAVAEIVVAAPVAPWQAIGLQIVDDAAWIGAVRLRFVPASAGAVGVVGWTLLGSPSAPADIDGLPTTYVDEIEVGTCDHPLGVVGFDHLVVMTSSLERTCAAIESVTGEPLKRVREAGAIRQGFHRLGPLVVEVVETAQVTTPTAEFWGFVLVVDDIHDAAGRLGPDVIALPKPAVQPGRLIASFRPAAGLEVPVALMSPAAPR